MVSKRPSSSRVNLKDEQEIEMMRRAGKIVALSLLKMGECIRPGVTTGELDAIAEQTIRGLGAKPAFLGYRGYPATACISVNDEVVHGIPGPRVLREGDIVGIDLGAIVDGWHGDAAKTFAVGAISDDALKLLKVGQEALAAGIARAMPGNRLRDVSAAIQRHIESHGFSVVRELCGHGIGQKLHEEPQIPNYVTGRGDIVLTAGMTLAIEPMLNAGRREVRLLGDDWTFVTSDGSLSAHFEHTIAIRADGPEILTALPS